LAKDEILCYIQRPGGQADPENRSEGCPTITVHYSALDNHTQLLAAIFSTAVAAVYDCRSLPYMERAEIALGAKR
jgi:hypothetical protein